jgi:hypothetical protein
VIGFLRRLTFAVFVIPAMVGWSLLATIVTIVGGVISLISWLFTGHRSRTVARVYGFVFDDLWNWFKGIKE